MAKDPAFLFYPGDYIAGTMHLDLESKGAYMELLMLQFQKDHMTTHMIKHVLGHKYEHIWPLISDKFQVKDGKFWNERLKIEKEKRSTYCKSRKKNRISVKNIETHMSNHMSEHMENENINEDISIKGGVGGNQETDYYTNKIVGHWKSEKALEVLVIGEFDQVKFEISLLIVRYTPEQIMKSISNYAHVLASPNHYFTHRYSLQKFLKSGVDQFMDEMKPLDNYLKNNNKKEIDTYTEKMQARSKSDWEYVMSMIGCGNYGLSGLNYTGREAIQKLGGIKVLIMADASKKQSLYQEFEKHYVAFKSPVIEKDSKAIPGQGQDRNIAASKDVATDN